MNKCDFLAKIHSFPASSSSTATELPTKAGIRGCARNLAVTLGVPMELQTGYGHFSGGDGITELRLVLGKLT